MPLFYLRQFDRLRLQMWKLVKVRVTQLNEVKSFALDDDDDGKEVPEHLSSRHGWSIF